MQVGDRIVGVYTGERAVVEERESWFRQDGYEVVFLRVRTDRPKLPTMWVIADWWKPLLTAECLAKQSQGT